MRIAACPGRAAIAVAMDLRPLASHPSQLRAQRGTTRAAPTGSARSRERVGFVSSELCLQILDLPSEVTGVGLSAIDRRWQLGRQHRQEPNARRDSIASP